jgi:prepilin-type processing-associated H-X9-DG protein
MEPRLNFTKKDMVVVLACVVLLLMNISAIGTSGRERAKRSVCLVNLKQLTTAWSLYANDNDGFIVNGAAGIYRLGENPWVGKCWYDPYGGGQLPTKEELQAEIRKGALWSYCKSLGLYRCGTGRAAEVLNYAIVDSMNGYPQPGNTHGRGPVDTLIIKNKEQIESPPLRAVFIDQWFATPDSYAVHYDRELWWDPPPVQHNDGATLSFADGHTEYWKWKGRDTIAAGKMTNPPSHFSPTTPAGREDLHRMQIAVWGRLGYSP